MKSVFGVKGAKEKHQGTEGSHKRGDFGGQCPMQAIEGSPGGSDNKKSTCNVGNLGSIPGWEDPLEEGMATHPSILAGRIPMDRGAWWVTIHGSQRVRHDRGTKHSTQPHGGNHVISSRREPLQGGPGKHMTPGGNLDSRGGWG